MRKQWIALMLFVCLLFGAALAEESAITPLPFSLTPGHVADEANYGTDEDGNPTYTDASITVQMSRVEVGDATYNVARVRIADASQLRTALSAKYSKNMRHDRISTMAKNNNAIVAIGGDYFHNEEGGYVIRQGETLRKQAKNRDVLLIDENGDFHIYVRLTTLEPDKKWSAVKSRMTDELKALAEGTPMIVNTFNFGPALVIDGVKQEMPSDYVYNLSGKEPRCAIGQLGELEYLLVVVDGRRKDSNGCTGAELAQFMADQGCVQAYNLDGGNSALMVFHNENYSDKSVEAERGVSDIIYFATAIDLGLDGTAGE